ncbi:hypothetical protein [Anaerostipes hadrus]|uniref:hypothetical protein n=1 Tax=Anaerostipes hadrus TaxID=649756 RepID=UPI001FC8D311|nr:hypothetical protein [Anaerostipes hadrus]
MNYNTVYVGMDVHKESFTLCSCKYEDEKASHYQRTPASYKNVLRYLAFLRTIYGEDTRFCVWLRSRMPWVFFVSSIGKF